MKPYLATILAKFKWLINKRSTSYLPRDEQTTWFAHVEQKNYKTQSTLQVLQYKLLLIQRSEHPKTALRIRQAMASLHTKVEHFADQNVVISSRHHLGNAAVKPSNHIV